MDFQENFFQEQSREEIMDMLLKAVEQKTLLRVTFMGQEGEEPITQKLTPVSMGNENFVFTDKMGDTVIISLDKIKMVQLPNAEEKEEAK